MICIRVHDSQMPWPTKRKPSNTASSGSPGGIFPLIFTLRRTQSLLVSSGSGQALKVMLLECDSDRNSAHRPKRSGCSKSEIICRPVRTFENKSGRPKGPLPVLLIRSGLLHSRMRRSAASAGRCDRRAWSARSRAHPRIARRASLITLATCAARCRWIRTR